MLGPLSVNLNNVWHYNGDKCYKIQTHIYVPWKLSTYPNAACWSTHFLLSLLLCFHGKQWRIYISEKMRNIWQELYWWSFKGIQVQNVILSKTFVLSKLWRYRLLPYQGCQNEKLLSYQQLNIQKLILTNIKEKLSATLLTLSEENLWMTNRVPWQRGSNMKRIPFHVLIMKPGFILHFPLPSDPVYLSSRRLIGWTIAK